MRNGWKRSLKKRRTQPQAELSLSGRDLLAAARHVGTDDPAMARAVAFSVAQAVNAGTEEGLRALHVLLREGHPTSVLDVGTIINTLSALEFAAVLPKDRLDGWRPPATEVSLIIELARRMSDPVGEQARHLVRVLDDRDLAGEWLTDLSLKLVEHQMGPNEGALAAGSVELVGERDEFPCVPA